MKHIGVFLSAQSPGDVYERAAQELGTLIPQHGYGLVYGASAVGLMDVLATAALKQKGYVTGINMELLNHTTREGLSETIVLPSLFERRQMLVQKSDAIVTLPGGIGSLDEVTEILELKKHDQHTKPVVLVNIDGFYDGLKMQLERMHTEGFLPKPLNKLVFFAATPQEAITYLNDIL